jgi:hypothetical protein
VSETPGYLPPRLVLNQPLAGPDGRLSEAFSHFWAATYAHEALRRGVPAELVSRLADQARQAGRGLLAGSFEKQARQFRARAGEYRAHPWLVELLEAAPGALSGPPEWALLAVFLRRIALLMLTDRALLQAIAKEPPTPRPPGRAPKGR